MGSHLRKYTIPTLRSHEISRKMVSTSQVDEISWQLLVRTHEISLVIVSFNEISSKMVTELKMKFIDDYR